MTGHTPIPNALLDRYIARLSGAGLKVLLIIIKEASERRSNTVALSLSQIQERTGLTRVSCIKATNDCIEQGVLNKIAGNSSASNSWEITL